MDRLRCLIALRSRVARCGDEHAVAERLPDKVLSSMRSSKVIDRSRSLQTGITSSSVAAPMIPVRYYRSLLKNLTEKADDQGHLSVRLLVDEVLADAGCLTIGRLLYAGPL